MRALSHALDSGRVHHAFLFSGTRGVGKTTIARIFAKSLNCERGTSAEPCGECNACRDIDAGRFIDLLEIDAASNTGVDDVREVIENAQYMPSRGRVKVYLVDEVHMLSKAAFNALLKTLEEPPEHVKFLLATTDPQKLPVTVLSRCLQFNLKRLDEGQIAGQLTMILGAEGIPADATAVRALSRAADGSLRDGLSLLDQAIAYAGGKLDEATVATMLGSVDRARIGALLSALADGDGAALLREVGALAEFAPDWNDVLDALADALHRVQVLQLVPDAAADDEGAAAPGVDVAALAASLRPEIVQLWYQVALNARRDLPLAPAPRAGFEMAVLRMLAFRPLQDAASAPPAATPAATPAAASGAGRGSASAAAAARAALADAAPRAAAAPPAAAAVPPQAHAAPTPAPTGRQLDAAGWLDVVAGAGLTGPARQLAAHVAFLGHEGNVLRLALSPQDELLKTPNSTRALAQALAPALGAEPQLRFEAGAAAAASETLHQRDTRERGARQEAAESAFMADPGVQALMQRHGATLVPDSIRPHDE